MEIDPTMSGAPGYQPTPRWGSIFDPVDGRLVNCSFTNMGTVDIAANFTPAPRTFPLGSWTLNGGQVKKRPVPEGCIFTPLPQYAEVLRTVPKLKDCFTRLSVGEQMILVRTFVPAQLLPYAEKIMKGCLAKVPDSRTPQTRP